MSQAAGSRGRGSRLGRPPATSREEIAAGALRLAREQGLDAVTIRKLSEFMNVAPMTLYKYVQTKDDLIDLMVATALSTFGSEPDASLPWSTQLHTTMINLYETLTENPVVIELLIAPNALTGPTLDHVRDAVLRLIGHAPLTPAEAIDLFNTLGAFVVGLVAIETGRARRADALTGHLRDLADDEFPALTGSRDVWMRPVPSTMVSDGLWHLIDGFVASRPDASRTNRAR